jgi:hypothetical protein
VGSLDQVGADQLGGAQHRIHQQQGILSQVNDLVDGCVRRRAAGPETDRGTSGEWFGVRLPGGVPQNCSSGFHGPLAVRAATRCRMTRRSSALRHCLPTRQCPSSLAAKSPSRIHDGDEIGAHHV